MLRKNSYSCSCVGCGFDILVTKGIPLLVKDRERIDHLMNEVKRSSRASWYEDSQLDQWHGPYRHHVKKRRRYVENVLGSYIKQVESPIIGLDLCCGDGGNLPWLSKHFSEIYASDYNLLRLLRASTVAGAKQIFMADVTDYPVLDNSFDVIYFNHALEHIPDDEKALSEVYRILKPRGLLILGTPNEGALFWQLAYHLQPKVRLRTDHVHFYTAESLRKKCSKAGFVTQEVRPIGWGVPHWWLDSMIRRYKWVDDLFEMVGRQILPSQATSLYLVLYK